MGYPTRVLPGLAAALYMQSASSTAVVALSASDLTTFTATSAIGNGAAAGASGLRVPAEVIPAWGYDPTEVTFTQSGNRYSDKIVVQATPTSMQVECPWNPSEGSSSAWLGIIQSDAANGTVDRTFVISSFDGANIVNLAFNARVSAYQIDMNPTAEGKVRFTIVPRGGQFGFSVNTTP